METIDNLSLESDSNSGNNSSLSSLNFRLLLTSVFADRMAYYGLRAVMILYAVNQFEVTKETAFYHYGYLSLAVCIAQLLGGFLGDLVLGARNGMLVGFGLCTTGALVITIQDPIVFYAGIFLIALGSGFTRVNALSLVGHGTSEANNTLLEKRFISMYAIINLGAFLSTLVIAAIGESFGYIYSFLIIIVLYGLSLVLTFIIEPKTNETLLNNNSVSRPPRPITKSLLIIILTIIACAVFWIVYEKYSMNSSFHRMEYLRSQFSSYVVSDLIWSLSVIVLMLLSIPYYFVAKNFSVYLKVGIGMALIGVCWFTSALLESELFSFGLGSLLFLVFVEAIAELFVSPIALVLLSKHTTRRYYGIVFAIYSLFIYFGGRLLYYTESSFFNNAVNVGLVVLIVASIVLYSVLSFTERTSTDSKEVEQL